MEAGIGRNMLQPKRDKPHQGYTMQKDIKLKFTMMRSRVTYPNESKHFKEHISKEGLQQGRYKFQERHGRNYRSSCVTYVQKM